MKTSSEKTTPKYSSGRYILIVGAAFILAILLYAALQLSDTAEESPTDAEAKAALTNTAVIGVQPASIEEIAEFRDGEFQRLRLTGRAEPNGVVVITNLGTGLRQVRVNDLGQWGVTLDVEDGSMALEAQLYHGEKPVGIRSEETVFRLPVSDTSSDSMPQPDSTDEAGTETEITPDSPYKTSALIMVTAPGRPSTLIQSPYGGTPTSGPLSLSVIDYDVLGGVIITGTSSVPGRIRLYAQDSVIGETGIGVGGRWNFIAGRMLPRAKIRLTAELIPALGAPNAPAERVAITVPFIFLPPLKEEDTDGSGALSLYVDPDQWQVRRTLIGGGGQTTVIYAPQKAEEEIPEPDSENVNETTTE